MTSTSYLLGIALVASLLLVTSAQPRGFAYRSTDPDVMMRELFDNVVREANIRFEDAAEELRRFEIFETNAKQLLQFLQNPDDDATYEINEFALRTPEEMSRWLSARFPADSFVLEQNDSRPVRRMVETQAPTAFDWRDKGVIQPIKDQGGCGSCWAHAVTSVIESRIAVALGVPPPSLSEQFFVSCDAKNFGCDGGWVGGAFDFMTTNGGMPSTATYPYTSGQTKQSGICDQTKAKEVEENTKIMAGGYTSVPSGQWEDHVSTYGPIVASANSSRWGFYVGGVLDSDFICPPGGGTDHAIVIVGYGVEKDKKYWIVRNHWGASKAEGGYLRIARGKNRCMIELYPGYYPIYSTFGLVLIPGVNNDGIIGKVTGVKVPVQVQNGQNYPVLPTPTLSGCTFDYWSTSQVSAGTKITTAMTVSLNKAQTLYAKYKPSTCYTVTFDSAGGVGTVHSIKACNCAPYGLVLPLVTRSMHRFVGWFKKDQNYQITASTIVKLTADTKLVAKWTPGYYVTFDWQNGTTPTKFVKYKGDEYGSLPVATKKADDSVYFKGWYTGQNGGGSKISPTDIVMIVKDQTLYAFFETVPKKPFSGTITTCDAWVSHTYATSQDLTMTIRPVPLPDRMIRLDFETPLPPNTPAFSIDGCGDMCTCGSLTVYDGVNSQNPVLATMCGASVPLNFKKVTATRPQGALTLRFKSDAGKNGGFTFRVRCIDPPAFEMSVGPFKISSGIGLALFVMGVIVLGIIVVGAAFGISLLRSKRLSQKAVNVADPLAEELVEIQRGDGEPLP